MLGALGATQALGHVARQSGERARASARNEGGDNDNAEQSSNAKDIVAQRDANTRQEIKTMFRAVVRLPDEVAPNVMNGLLAGLKQPQPGAHAAYHALKQTIPDLFPAAPMRAVKWRAEALIHSTAPGAQFFLHSDPDVRMHLLRDYMNREFGGDRGGLFKLYNTILTCGNDRDKLRSFALQTLPRLMAHQLETEARPNSTHSQPKMPPQMALFLAEELARNTERALHDGKYIIPPLATNMTVALASRLHTFERDKSISPQNLQRMRHVLAKHLPQLDDHLNRLLYGPGLRFVLEHLLEAPVTPLSLAAWHPKRAPGPLHEQPPIKRIPTEEKLYDQDPGHLTAFAVESLRSASNSPAPLSLKRVSTEEALSRIDHQLNENPNAAALAHLTHQLALIASMSASKPHYLLSVTARLLQHPDLPPTAWLEIQHQFPHYGPHKDALWEVSFSSLPTIPEQSRLPGGANHNGEVQVVA